MQIKSRESGEGKITTIKLQKPNLKIQITNCGEPVAGSQNFPAFQEGVRRNV